MKYISIIALLFISFSLSAQEKGAAPLPAEASAKAGGQAYAVVIGISDYQDEAIPDLRFADKDAEAFAHFLRSSAGGSMDEDHLKVLLNEEATAGRIAAALYWLIDECREGDQVFIYFSGHGDVERKLLGQPGHLLCWDAPARVYMAGGTLGLNNFQLVISTLSLENKAKVFVITDACRSGKLAGSNIEGSKLTNSNLAQQYAKEIKILSCQPDEYSIEGEQWGGGRGAFSYHLLDGLYGMADKNADQSISLMEIRSYLEEKVSTEVAPENQLPMVVGNGREKLADVIPGVLEQLKKNKKGQMQMFAGTESRGIEDEVLAAADSNIVEMYVAFQQAIKDKRFLEPANDSSYAETSADKCADFYYEKLSTEAQLKRLHAGMRRNYAAALQDDAQQVLNKLLNSQPFEVNKSFYTVYKNYGNYPTILRRAAELLGPKHYMYRPLMARSYWFEGYVKDESNCTCVDSLIGKKVLRYYRKALEYQPDMPHAWFRMAIALGLQLENLDSMEYYMNRAIELVPGWTAAYYWAAFAYNTHGFSGQLLSNEGTLDDEKLRKGRTWLEKGLTIDSSSVLLLSELGDYYSRTGAYEKAEKTLNQAIGIEPTRQAHLYQLANYSRWEKYDKAEATLLKAVELDSSVLFNIMYGEYYWALGRDDKVEEWMQQLIDMDLKDSLLYSNLGQYYTHWIPGKSLKMLYKAFDLGFEEAVSYNWAGLNHSYLSPIDTAEELRLFQKAVELDPNMPIYHVNEGGCYLRQNQFEKAKAKFLHAASLGIGSGDRQYVIYSYTGLYMLYVQNGMIADAEAVLQKSMARDEQNFLDALAWYAYRVLQDPETADTYFKKVEKLYPDRPLVNFYFATHLCFFEKNNEAAFQELEKAFEKGFNDRNLLGIEYRFRGLRLEKDRWDALMKKYFPEEPKD